MNLQRLNSNVHLVMCHTKNALVKSNTLAALNPTWAHFVMVSQKLLPTVARISILNDMFSFSIHSIYIYRNYLHSLNKVYIHTLQIRGLEQRH
jgi:uncharacterized membrane protein (GlpM family)